LRALIELTERSGAFLLVDETYRDLAHEAPLPMAASLSTRAISVSSMSKAYGLPGLRVGWAVCRDAVLAETLLAAKEQMLICGPTLDEAIAGQVLVARERILPPILDDARARLAIVREWLAPTGRVRVGSSRPGASSAWSSAPGDRRRHEALLRRSCSPSTVPYVGPGHWFEVDDRSFRLGYRVADGRGTPRKDSETVGRGRCGG